MPYEPLTKLYCILGKRGNREAKAGKAGTKKAEVSRLHGPLERAKTVGPEEKPLYRCLSYKHSLLKLRTAFVVSFENEVQHLRCHYISRMYEYNVIVLSACSFLIFSVVKSAWLPI